MAIQNTKDFQEFIEKQEINDERAEIIEKIIGAFSESGVCLKTGERSKMVCSNAGIVFTPEEYEAMTILDKTAEEYEEFRDIVLTAAKVLNHKIYHRIHQKDIVYFYP